MHRSTRTLWSVIPLLGLVAACGQGASPAEFVQACMQSNQREVTEAMCQCAAREAQASMSSDEYRAMVLDMQGKKQEAEQSLGDVSVDDRAAFAMKQFELLEKCAAPT